jgi:hypothetical protein
VTQEHHIGKNARWLVIYLGFTLACLVVSCCLSIAHAQTVNRQAVLNWQAPTTCEGGSAITNCPIRGYSVQKLIGTTWTELGTTVASVRTYTHTNLPLGTHTYRVLATSDAGPSNPSNEVTRIIDVPGAPGGIVITVTVTVTP